MLYLGHGVRQLSVGEDNRALYVFPDFADKNQFYYLPNFPQIAKMSDGTPAIRLLIYREDLDTIDEDAEEAVGFLSLDVDLAWPADIIEEAASALRLEDRLDQKPRLTPIFFRKGSVKLMLLDASTPDEDAAQPDQPQPTQFVTSIMGASSPSLYGDNRAIFQASLSKKGAAALSGALDGVTPIGVVYSLTFAGLQPAFNIKARVDWEKVYDHFSEQEKLNLLFYEKEIQKSIDTMVENKTIQLEITVEGIGAEAADEEREKVMNSVRQLIFEQFFEATFEREDAIGSSTADDIVDTLTHIHKNAHTFGIGYTYRRKEVKVEELRTLNIDWTMRKAAERTIYPQAHMHNLMTGSAITEDQLITIVDGGAAAWKVLPFRVSAAAAWEADGIAGISVDIEYDDADSGAVRHWSTFLDKDQSEDTHRDWMDRTSGNKFRYKYEVVFQDEAVPGPRPKVDSGEDWIEHEGTVLVLQPRELYESIELEVAAIPTFPFDRWPAVQAIMRYRTDDGSYEHYEDGVIQASKKNFSTRFRVDKDTSGQREIRLTYIGASGEQVETGWMPMEQDEAIVTDPHPNKLVIRAMVAGDRRNTANLIVDLEYTDEENGIHETGTLMFDKENIMKPLAWTVNLADPTKRRYRYRMTLITADTGDFVQTGWIGTDAPTIPVGEKYVRQLTVQVVTKELAPGVESVKVELEYDDRDEDSEGGEGSEDHVHETETFILGPNDQNEWQIQLKNPSKRSYQYTITWLRSDGFNPTKGPKSSNDTLLEIPASPNGG